MYTLVKFGAPWCAPCKQLDTLLDTMVLDIPIVKVDVEEDTDTAMKFGIRQIPTIALVRDGVAISTICKPSKQQIIDLISAEVS